jgi:cyclopropane fatty-acyl-phospholipid synthase-like methyltransferase
MLSPAPIIKLATDYWKSRTFLAAVNLNIFGILGSEEYSLSDISEQTKINVNKLKPFLGALEKLELIEINNDMVRSTQISQMYLHPESPATLAPSFRYSTEMYPLWDQIEEKLKSTQNIPNAPSKKDTPGFLLSMHSRAQLISTQVLSHMEMKKEESLLDIAAGAGTWSLLLQKKFNLESVHCVEQPELMESMREFITDLGLKANFSAADYHTWTANETHDHVLFFGALHQNDEEDLNQSITQLWKNVSPGGKIYILDLFTGADKDNDLFAFLFGLNMILTNGGNIHDVDLVKSFLTNLDDCDDCVVHPIRGEMPYALLVATKK